MLVKMEQTVFDSLDDTALGWACIEPTIQLIRGKNLTVKSEVYEQLTYGQRALLMFWIIFGHTRNGVAQFLSEMSFLLSQIDIWSELKAGLGFFRDDDMLSIIADMEDLYRSIEKRNQLVSLIRKVVHGQPQEDMELVATLSRLDSLLQEITPTTIKLISNYIRNNPNEFVQLEN